MSAGPPAGLHHGRYGPEGPLRRSVQKTAENPQLEFINKVVFIPVVLQRRIPRSDCSRRPLRFSYCLTHGGRCPCCGGRAGSLVADSQLFVASPEEYMIRIFWEMTSGIISVLSTLRFDSGYMYGVSLRGFGSFSHDFPRGRRIQRYAWFNSGYMHCVSLLRLGIFTEFLREGGFGP